MDNDKQQKSKSALYTPLPIKPTTSVLHPLNEKVDPIIFIHSYFYSILQSMKYYNEAITIYYAVWTRLTREGCFEWLTLS